MARMLGWAGCAALLFFACGPRLPKGLQALTDLPPAADAPYELASDHDLDAVRAQYDVLPPGTDERRTQRARLATEYKNRIERQIETNRYLAFKRFKDLLSLWSAQEIRDGAVDMRGYRDTAELIYNTFSRSGGDIESVTALVALMEMNPAHRQEYLEEIEVIFAFADDLAVAQYGDGAQDARPIEILETATESFPSDWAVDELVEIYRTRQKALDSRFRRNGADIGLIRAHGEGALRTVWNITRVLARAGRIADADAAVADITGIGDDATLRARLKAATRARSADPWVLVAASLRAEPGDNYAALQVCFEAMKRAPKDPSGYLAAADTARALGSIPLAIRLYEKGLELSPEHHEASAQLAHLYEYRVTDLAFNDRPNAAHRQLERFERFHKAASKRLDTPLEPDLANAYAAMGRGLVSLGELDRANNFLRRSLELRPTAEALEHLGTVALKQRRYDDAIAYLEQALALPEQAIADRFDRIKVMRLTGEAYAGSKNWSKANAYLHAAVRSWNELTRTHELPRPFLAESLSERGKIFWYLGEEDAALNAFEAAVDVHPGGSSLHADIVSFLLIRGRYRSALDTFHRALGNRDIGQYFKVYMSLWMVAEARRRGVDPDHHALDYLRSRNGSLWYDSLARYATGRAELSRLEALATTKGRRAELLYYTALLQDPPDPETTEHLLERVLDSDMVLFFEYEMAQHWLRSR